MEENETIIKSANDLKVTITKLNGERVVDEDCCTSIVLMLKNNGQIGTSFLGAHNPEILKALKKAVNQYLRVLKKQLKTAPSMDDVVVNKDEPLDEDKIYKAEDVELKTNNDKVQPQDKSSTDKSTTNKSKSNKTKLNKTASKSHTDKSKKQSQKSEKSDKTNSNKIRSDEEKSIEEVQEIIKDIKRMQDEYKKESLNGNNKK